MPDTAAPIVDIAPIEAWKRRWPEAAAMAYRIVTEIEDNSEVCLIQSLDVAGFSVAVDELEPLWNGAA